MIDKPGLRLGLGNCADYTGDADLVFTHIYGPLPKQLIGRPAILNVYGNKKAKAEEWCGAELYEVTKWARGTNTVYAANWSYVLDLSDLVEVEFAPNRGWFPQELTDRLLIAFLQDRGVHGITVWDGFMGRGTVGKSCAELDCGYIGIDRDPERVEIARGYLGC